MKKHLNASDFDHNTQFKETTEGDGIIRWSFMVASLITLSLIVLSPTITVYLIDGEYNYINYLDFLEIVGLEDFADSIRSHPLSYTIGLALYFYYAVRFRMKSRDKKTKPSMFNLIGLIKRNVRLGAELKNNPNSDQLWFEHNWSKQYVGLSLLSWTVVFLTLLYAFEP